MKARMKVARIYLRTTSWDTVRTGQIMGYMTGQFMCCHLHAYTKNLTKHAMCTQ